MSKLIYCTRSIPEVGVKMIRDAGYVLDIGENKNAPTKQEIINALTQKEYDGMISFLTDDIDAEVLNSCKSLKIVFQYSVGFNNIDLVEAKAKNIIVTNTPNCSSRAVAEQAVALMLSLTTRSVEGDVYVRAGKFTGWSPDLLNGMDLSCKTIGIFGVGGIGRELASILHFGFDCKIIYNDIKQNLDFEEKFNAKFMSKEELLRSADVVSLHVPLMPETKHMIDAEALKLMKSTAYLINTSRGPVVDEVALVQALQNGVIRGAGLDVFEFEPELSVGLKNLPNVVLTPHIASSRESVRNKMSEVVAQNIISFFETGTAINPVEI